MAVRRHNPAILVSGLFVITSIAACGDPREIANSRAEVATLAQVAGCPAPAFSFSVTDPADDSFGSGSVIREIVNVAGEGDGTTFCLTVDFAGALDPGTALTGYVEFDTDADAWTGFANQVDNSCPRSGIGSEATLFLGSTFEGTAPLIDRVTNATTRVPITFGSSTSFTAAIPLSAIGGDNAFNFAMVLGGPTELTDCAPNGASIHSPDGTVVPAPPPPPPPANDGFAAATRIAALPFTENLSNVGATVEPGERTPFCAGSIGNTVWYSFTPNVDMRIAADTFGSQFKTVLAVFTGTEFANLETVGCQLFDRLFLNLTAGTTYYFQVGGSGGEVGNLFFNVAPVLPPANDNFASATPIASVPFADSVSTQGATSEPGEPSPPCAPAGNTVWYSFKPNVDMRIAADTIGSNFNTVLAAFSGTDFANLQPLGCQLPFGTPLILNLTAGTTYYFQVGGYSGAAGNLVFNIVVTPANDSFIRATRIAALPFTDSLSTAGATTEVREPSACVQTGSTVWYSFTPTADMQILADTFGSSFDTVIAAYTGTDLANLQPVGCMLFGGFNRLFLKLVAGNTYYFQVGGYVGAKGDLVFNVVPFDGPANNNFARATPIASFPFKDSLNTLGATVESSEPSPSCAPGGSTVWYSFTPSADMRIVADTIGSSFSTVLAAFAGTDFATLKPLGCQAFSPRLVLEVNAGVTYYFQVGGYQGAIGDLVFNLVAYPRPTNDNFANATNITALPFTDSLSTAGATTELGEPSPPCGRVSNTVWYAFTPAVDMTIAVDSAGSNFNPMIAAFVGSDFGTLHPVGCMASGRLFLDLKAGTTYHFQVGGEFGQSGNVVFNMAAFVRPANDAFANARVIVSLPFADALSTEGTTGEPGEVNPPCGTTANSSVWYTFTPTADMSIAIDTLGSNFNTVVGVYTGRTLADLQPIGCVAFSERLLLDLRAGTTYYFQVGGWFGQTGHLVFNVAPFVRFALSLSINPAGTVVRSTGIATVTGVVTCSKPASVNLRGSLRQRMGRGVISGSLLVSMPCDGATPWKADVAADGGSFAGGNADLSVSAFAFTPNGESATVELSTTVRLQSIR